MDEKSKKNVPPESLPEPPLAVQQEDAVMKTMMQFFAEELLYLELKKLNQDFNLVMEDGTGL